MKETIAVIKDLLNGYRHNRSELCEMVKAKESLMVQLDGAKCQVTETVDDVIEGMSLQAMRLSHIPRTITNKFSSQTENIALNYLEEMKPVKVDCSKLLVALAEVDKRIEKLQDDLSLSDNLIEVLEDRKKFVIKHKYINGYSLAEIMILHNQTFPIPKERITIEQMKYEAEKEMARWYLKVLGA